MSINVCSEGLETIIQCSCVTADGYEVENLLKEQTIHQGFQAERFTRCPVFILLKFSVPIDLHQIIIQPWLGRQCVKIVQIYTFQKPINTSEKVEFDDIRFKAGTATITSQTKVVFNNKRYRKDPKLKCVPQSSPSEALECGLKGQFNHVTALKIGLHVMLNGSIPSVRSLKVFGKPSPNSNKTDADNFLFRWRNNLKISEIEEPSSSSIKPEKMGPQESLHNVENDITQKDNFPEIFIDPITCTRMTNPILLPSGHTIDHKTLDKHILTLEERGRLPSDPFTGIIFTESCKPTPNVFLKQKLDRYSMGISSNEEINKSLEVSKKRSLEAADQSSIPKKRNMEQDNDSSSRQKPSKIIEKNLTFRRIHNNSTSMDNLHCFKCNVYLSSTVPQYALPCHHNFCRKCSLIISSNLKCPTCYKEFSYSDMKRVHIDLGK